MLKIRRPLGRLIFNMGIAIPGKTVFLIETAPRCHVCSIFFHNAPMHSLENSLLSQWEGLIALTSSFKNCVLYVPAYGKIHWIFHTIVNVALHLVIIIKSGLWLFLQFLKRHFPIPSNDFVMYTCSECPRQVLWQKSYRIINIAHSNNE